MHAVITAAGLGTRMLPASKEIPKEMFPIPFQGSFKPIIQIIFEQLFDLGIRDFVIIVGKGKRVIEDHFTPDYDFISYLENKGKYKQAEDLRSFYQKIERSNIAFVNQPEPRGFGDAVLRAEPFVKDFILIAADTILKEIPLEKMRVNSFLITEVEDPRPYGVVVIEGEKVIDVEEKPSNPKSKLIIVPYYHFDEEIFSALREISVDRAGELQLTDGIKYLMRKGREFHAIKVDEVYDLGNVENYISSLKKLLIF